MTAVKLYQYKTCSTCRKARKWLEEEGVEFELSCLIEETPTREDLVRMWKKSGLDLKRFFNVNGGAYRERELKDKYDGYSDDQRLEMLSEDGLLIKRPLLETPDTVLVGFREEEYAEAFSG